MSLSKSRYCRGVQCKKILWMEKYKPNEKEDINNDSVFETGNTIHEVAKYLFGRHVNITYSDNLQEMIDNTYSTIDSYKDIVITEASFNYHNNFCSVDILKKQGNNYEIYEVKSSTKLKDIYLDDISYQYYVLSSLGLNIKKCTLVHLNSDYVRNGSLNLDELFKMEDVTDVAKSKKEEIEKNVREINKYLETKNENDYLILKICLTTKRTMYEMVKNQCNDEAFINILQMGFILVESDYASYPDVKYFMAQSMIEEIMMSEIFEIEGKMHMKYGTKENMMHVGVNKIILDIIESYDSNLRNYVMVKNDLLEPFKKIMNSIIYNWDEYKRKNDINKCDLDDIVSLVNEFILDNDEFYGMEGTLIYYLEKEFNLNIKGTYLDISDEDVEYLKEGINDVHEVELSILSLKEQKKLQEFKRIIKNFMMSSDKKISYESLKEKVKK